MDNFKTVATKVQREVAEMFIRKSLEEKKLPSEKLKELIINYISGEIKEKTKEQTKEVKETKEVSGEIKEEVKWSGW